MEKISTTPMPVGNNNNNNKLSGISSNTNTKEGNGLNLDFDGMPKLNESSVRAVPLRANFKKSNTCGSLFAKCKCDNHPHPHHYHTTVIPLITETDCDRIERLKIDRNRRKTQSFSHPDTPIIFTEENRYPATTTADLLNRLRTSQDQGIVRRSGNQKLEIKHSKRSSSPNLIGEFNIVDIHPEFKVQIAPKSPIKQTEVSPTATTLPQTITRPTPRPILKKSSRSFPFTGQHSPSLRSFDSLGERSLSSSSYSVDEASEEIELCGKVSDSLVINDLDANAKSTPLRIAETTSTVAEIHNKDAASKDQDEEEANGANSECKTNEVKVPLSPSISKDFSDEKFLQVNITHVPFALPHSLTMNELFLFSLPTPHRPSPSSNTIPCEQFCSVIYG